jgi:Protein of unknown function (DUF2975)
MRAMGPGSVSSLLKTALDVVYYLLLAVAGVLLVLAGLALILSYDPGQDVTLPNGVKATLTTSLLAEGLALFAVYFGVVVAVLGRVRKIFATLTVGDPFHPANVNRLRWIGAGLAGLEALLFVGRTLLNLQIPGAVRGWPIDVTAWFAVLIVFVLAEVFREGARLRREAELTI